MQEQKQTIRKAIDATKQNEQSQLLMTEDQNVSSDIPDPTTQSTTDPTPPLDVEKRLRALEIWAHTIDLNQIEDSSSRSFESIQRIETKLVEMIHA
eukprot:6468826-Amphidinium_carterae.1